MNRFKQPYFIFRQLLPAVLMMLSLLWLTVSLPYVYKAQQALKIAKHSLPDAEEEESCPFANTTEEKTPSANTLSEEYLHHTDEHPYTWTSIVRHHRDYTSSLYVAYHGELLSPPPEA